MVKLFFGGIAVFVLVVVGAFSAFFSPLLAGVNRNLGGPPKMPFHSPVPQPMVNAVNGAAAQVTPSVLLLGVFALAALLVVYTLGSLISHMVKRWQGHRKRAAELRWRARVAIGRDLHAQGSVSAKEAELEALWE